MLATATASGPGETLEIQTIGIAADGDYTVEITGDGATDYDLSLYRNASVEVFDTDDGSEQDATGSFIPLGSGRFGIVGNLNGSDGGDPPVQAGPIYSTQDDGTRLGTISKASGIGSDIGPFGTSQTWAAAFDTDGTLYTTINGFTGNARLGNRQSDNWCRHADRQRPRCELDQPGSGRRRHDVRHRLQQPNPLRDQQDDRVRNRHRRHRNHFQHGLGV